MTIAEQRALPKGKNPFPKAATQTPALGRILRPQAAYRWLLPQLAAITPQYIEMTLRGALAGNHLQAWELFDLMEDTWTRLRKNVLELKNGVLNLNRMFEPFAEEDEEPTDSAKERSRLVSSAIRRMSPEPAADENGFDGMIFDILDAWFKGVSVQEIDWQIVRAGQLGDITAPRSTYWVHPVCYAWSMEGRLGLRSDAAGRLSPGNISGPSYQPMPSSVMPFPDDKFLISICKTKSGTALGGALLRPLAWWWCASNFSADWLLNLAQVFGLPFRWANYDPNAPQETVDAICTMLQNMGSAGWAAFPAGTTLELKADGMKNGSDTPQGDILDRADKQCDLLVLGQTLTSDTGGGGKGGGSLALGKVHEGVKGEIIQAAANFAESVIENQLIPSILRLNYGDDQERPSIRLESEEESDLQADSAVIKTLADAGAGQIIGLDWLGKKFGIPKPGKDEETLKKAEPVAGVKDPTDPADRTDRTDLEDKAEPVLARLARIEDDGEFSEALLGYCRALKCGGNFDPSEARDKKGKWTKEKVGIHPLLAKKLGVEPDKVVANYEFLAAKHPEYFDTAAEAKAYTEHVLSHPTHLLPANSPKNKLVVSLVTLNATSEPRAVAVGIVKHGGVYLVKSAHTLRQSQFQKRLEAAGPGKFRVSRGVTR